MEENPEIPVDSSVGADPDPHPSNPGGGGREKLFITDEDNIEGPNRKKSYEDIGDGAGLSACVKEGEKEDSGSHDGVQLEKPFDRLSTAGGSSDDGDAHGELKGKKSMETSMISISDDEALEGASCPSWKDQRRHVFILSEAGKPIFSRHGNEEKLVTLFGVLQALVSFVQDSDDDAIKCIMVGDTKVVFLVKCPLILVCVSKMGESTLQIQTQLLYLYNQIVSILTAKQLLHIYEKRRNYDLRRLIQGSERLLYNLCNLVETEPSFILGAVRCLPLTSSVRDTISQTISQTLGKMKQNNVIFAILLANNQLVSLVRMKKCFMHPMDLHIIINFIDASESFKTAETWSPLCLPKFDSSGFVHAHVSYLSDECQACLVLLTVDRESFFILSEAKQKIVERLKRNNCLEAINASMNNNWPTMSFVNVPEVRHFLYKSRSIAQFMSPALEAPYIGSSSSTLTSPQETLSHQTPDALHNMSTSTISSLSESTTATGPPQYLPPDISVELQRLYSKYYRMHSKLHAQSRPVKLIYWVDDTENWLAWITSTFELYVTFEPLVKKSAALAAVNKLLKWIKKEEDRIFIMNSPTF